MDAPGISAADIVVTRCNNTTKISGTRRLGKEAGLGESQGKALSEGKSDSALKHEKQERKYGDFSVYGEGPDLPQFPWA